MATDARESELFALQKEYRIMEHNRRQYAEESQVLLRKQQSTIDKLRRDNEELKGEITMSMRSTSKSMSSTQQEVLGKLHESGDMYAQQIDHERRNIATMEEQIAIMKQKVLHQRKAMGGVNASKDNHFMIQKQIRILENRLDKALIKFNEAIAHNKTLRDGIDDLRRERVVFENIYKKMERELQERKMRMAEIIELSNQSYEQRDAYQMEISAIELANRKEHEDYDEQAKELTRMLENELKLPTPAASTGGTRTGSAGGGGVGGSGSHGGGGSAGALGGSVAGGGRSGTAGPGGPGGLGGTAGSTGGGVGDGTSALAALDNHSMERIQNFEEAFNKIKAATGITDIEELVRAFIKNEDHNFSLFNYVNEQNNEIEKLEEQLQALRDEEKHFAQESGEDVVQHKQILKELESKLVTTESMAEKYEMRCQDLQRVIESLKRGLQSVYERLDISSTGGGGGGGDDDDSVGGDAAAGGTGSKPAAGGGSEALITESNLVHYLGLIEQKANSILAKYTAVRVHLMQPPPNSSASAAASVTANDISGASNNKSIVAVLGSGPKVPMGQELVHVNPPKLDDYQSDDDDNDEDAEMRPLTRDELKARTLNRLQRRGGGAAAGAGAGGEGGGASSSSIRVKK